MSRREEDHDPHRPITEPDPRFPSGLWEGFYVQDGRKVRMTVDLGFQRTHRRRGHVCGEGRDAEGAPFQMVGTYDLDQAKVDLRKHYVRRHMVAYAGDVASTPAPAPGRSVGPMLQGRWDIRAYFLTGFWRLWVVDETDDEQWQLEHAEVDTREGPVILDSWADFERLLKEQFAL